jgi:arginyl-tRNA synthetase
MDAATRPFSSQIQIERARDTRHGDFACNAAMILAKALRRNPRELAQQIVAALPRSGLVEKVEVAGAGFINFFLTRQAVQGTVREALTQGERYGRSAIGQGQRVQVEFVSANPTGPLHIGHGRGAAYGATIANLLAATGHAVQREYYVNDAGRQMDILAVSVWLRYLEALGEPVSFPENAYRGAYVRDIAKKLEAQAGDTLRLPFAQAMGQFSPASDADAYVDALIVTAKDMLGPDRYRAVHAIGLNDVLDGIRQDLGDFGVEYDCWFSEGSLTEDDSVQRAIDKLEALGRLYLKDGARWFNAAAFGDEKDRVVVRENGQTTYFASDIAYHMHKFERGFEHVINVWGADHHGYVPRVKAALAALNLDPDKLEVLLVQFATLYRGKERVQMSTRSGEFVTLRELFEEVGKDAARFFYVLRRSEQHLDFDLELAKSQSNDNPVYYIQYAHARVSSVVRQLAEKGLSWDQNLGNRHLHLLGESQELALLNTLSRYPEVVEAAALNREPHLVAHYLRELANDFHVYYGAHQFLVDEPGLRNARLNLIAATQRVIRNGLELLGVSSPEVM